MYLCITAFNSLILLILWFISSTKWTKPPSQACSVWDRKQPIKECLKGRDQNFISRYELIRLVNESWPIYRKKKLDGICTPKACTHVHVCIQYTHEIPHNYTHKQTQFYMFIPAVVLCDASVKELNMNVITWKNNSFMLPPADKDTKKERDRAEH